MQILRYFGIYNLQLIIFMMESRLVHINKH